MKAAFITGHGGNDVVQVGERPGPERAPGEVRVRLHAAFQRHHVQRLSRRG